MSEPTEHLVLDLGREGNLDRALGGISLEFEATMVRFYLLLWFLLTQNQLWRFILRWRPGALMVLCLDGDVAQVLVPGNPGVLLPSLFKEIMSYTISLSAVY